MLRNLWVTAFRSLTGSPFHSALNILGLALGFAAAVLLSLYVHDELTWDHVFPADVYRISSSITMPGGVAVRFDGTDYVMAEGLKRELPQIETVARMMPQDWTLDHRQVEANETIYWADPTLFTVLPVTAVAGDPTTALDAPDSLVLTRSMARRFFGSDAPLGQTLRLNRRHLMRVTAVIEDLPGQTHLAGRLFGSGRTPFSNLAEMDARPPGFHFDGTTYTYFRLKPGASIEAVRAALPDLVVRHLLIPPDNPFGVAATLTVLPIRDIHFAPAGVNAMKAPGDRATVWAAAIVALLILVGACVNFVNLTTARVSRRAKEVGVRKAVGASRSLLVAQFLAESLLQVAAAMGLALSAVELLLPVFNGFLEREMRFEYWRPESAGAVLLATVAVTLLAGAYPALLLSGLRPATALRGGPAHLDRGRLRRALVLVQFAILTGLVISTVVIWRQTKFAADAASRLAGQNMLLVSAPCTDAIRNGLARLPGVGTLVCSQPTMIGAERVVEMMEISPAEIHSFETLSVDFGFLQAYGLDPLAGRLFDRSQGGDIVHPPVGAPQEIRIVVNRTAVRELGLADARDAIGVRLQSSFFRGQRAFTIIGVVPDFPTGSVRVPVAATVYFVDPSRFAMISARVAPGQLASASAGLRDLWIATQQPGLPDILPLQVYAEGLYRDIRREGILFASAAGIALAIACLGLFGMAAFIAEQRTKEIGIRKALGATTRQVTLLLLWQFSRPVLWANFIAWPIVWWLMRRWLDGFAAHAPLHPALFLAGGAFTLAVTLLTVAGHAILVARKPPVAALRHE
ncbi:ABC transporter permease [Sphingosinicella terrae]|uniref:ABC transporter permease n=1 Tax=Sphingosinicella terrae TaxID=2172047 RepID=UPI0013B3AE88|nr:ABC transporter permease [Sphingosinicella terrae]